MGAIVRSLELRDGEILHTMLRSEGVPSWDMGFSDHATFVLEQQGLIGFFTLGLVHDVFPHLKHFCVARSHRRPSTARLLIRAVCATVKELGFSRMIVHAPSADLRRFVRYYFKTLPYREESGTSFYLVRV